MKTRQQAFDQITRITDSGATFDVCVIGGGASGASCALDAQLRGLKTVLVDAGDFASGTSTASTKLAHGGVRYLQEAVTDLDVAQYRLVEDALRERTLMLHNAPYLTRTVEFLVPCFSHFDQFYYGLGMKMYDWISGKSSLLPSRMLTREEALYRMPAMQPKGLTGAVAYADGQFDDARYAMALVETFDGLGGAALNYARVTAFEKRADGVIAAAMVTDQLSKQTFRIAARSFVNATGPFSDVIRQLASAKASPRMSPSKGAHLLFPLDGFSEKDALLVPRTEDGRVIFAVPWNGRLLVGTTDTGYTPGEEMVVTRQEIDYLLRQLNPYLSSPLRANQLVSGFAGVRPLVSAQGIKDTKKLIRDDEVEFDAESGMISILGGKWTTHRLMGQQTVDKVQEHLGGPATPTQTHEHPLSGSANYHWDYWKSLVSEFHLPVATAQHLAHKYGTAASSVVKMSESDPSLVLPLIEGEVPIRAQVVYAARNEMASTIEDVLARRIGLQLIGWRLAIRATPVVAALLGRELGWSAANEAAAIEQYVGKVNHMLEVSGQDPEPSPAQTNELVLERS
jgi:glycerol-3-phosphate dehydrogenase